VAQTRQQLRRRVGRRRRQERPERAVRIDPVRTDDRCRLGEETRVRGIAADRGERGKLVERLVKSGGGGDAGPFGSDR
jgi:hypothetical protein